MTSKLTKKYAAAAASALVVGGVSLLALPANAQSATLNYDCAVPILGNKVFTAVVDTDAPASVPAGQAQALNATANVTVPANVVDAMRAAFQAKSVAGDALVKASINGVEGENTLTIASTPVPPSGTLTVPASGPGGTLPASTEGQKFTITAGGFTSNLVITKNDGSTQNFSVPCVPQAGQDLTVDTVAVTAAGTPTVPATPNPTPTPTPSPTPTPTPTPTPAPVVVKASTTTTAKVKYAAKKKKATVKVAVKAASGTAAGKATITLKKGSKKVKTVTVNVTSGKAKATFKKISAKGKYKVTVKFAGSTTTNASSGKATFKVS